MCRSKNAGVAGYAEAFRPVQSDSQTSEWYSYFENDVLVHQKYHRLCNKYEKTFWHGKYSNAGRFLTFFTNSSETGSNLTLSHILSLQLRIRIDHISVAVSQGAWGHLPLIMVSMQQHMGFVA